MGLSINRDNALATKCKVVFDKWDLSFLHLATPTLQLKEITPTTTTKVKDKYLYLFDTMDMGFLFARRDNFLEGKKIGEHNFILISSKDERVVYEVNPKMQKRLLSHKKRFEDFWVYECNEPYFEVEGILYCLRDDMFRYEANVGSVNMQDVTLPDVKLAEQVLPDVELKEIHLPSVELGVVTLPDVNFRGI